VRDRFLSLVLFGRPPRIVCPFVSPVDFRLRQMPQDETRANLQM